MICASLGAHCGATHPSSVRAGAGAGASVAMGGSGAARVRSNILRDDYAGSASCAGCHAEIHAAWRGSPMHLMTRLPDTARIHAPFEGATFRFKDDTARLSER